MKITYKFKRNVDIGSLDAENDRFLINAFVDKSDLSLLENIEDPKCIILGRTGSGKSALIRYLEEKHNNVIRINPESISLRHLSNSTIINYFNSIDVKLDLFYKVLWKHVFVVELIKLHFNNDLNKSIGILEWVKGKIPNKSKRKSIEYLEKWEDKFWEDTEYRVRELESSLEKRFQGELGVGIDLHELIKLSGSTRHELKKGQTVKYEVINKAQKVVNESQVEHINNIIDMMKTELFKKSQKKYFIVIDDLDKEWVSDKIVYDLIKALIETIKDLRIIPHVKIIIALRTNIHRKIIKKNMSRGVQREKYNQLYLNVQWNKNELISLINNRLRELMKSTYTNQNPTIYEILPEENKRQPSGFDYMIQHSSLKPREIIDFFNKCIKHADGKTKISRETIRIAEDEYSHERLRALNDEWLENFGNIHVLYGFLKGINNGFKLDEIIDVAGEYFLDVIGDESIKSLNSTWNNKFEKFGKDFMTEKLLKEILILIYEIGLIGIKKSSQNKLEYIYDSYSPFEVIDIKDDTKFYIHPMYHKSLRINK